MNLDDIAVSNVTCRAEMMEVIEVVEGVDNSMTLGEEGNDFDALPVVYARDGEVYNWSEQDYSHCTLYTLEEFRNKFIRKSINLQEIYDA